MEGVGELFGRSADAVLRRPRAALAPFTIDALTLLFGTFLFLSFAGIRLLFPQGYRLPRLPVAVPHALPTVGDVMGPTPAIEAFGNPAVVAAALLILILLPTLAYAEAGFLGVLRAVYLKPRDPLEEGRHPDAWSAIREAFTTTGRAHFRTFLVLRAIQSLLALAALFAHVLPAPLRNYDIGVFAVDVLLLYAPYAAIESGRGPFAAVRESVQLVSDYLATTLVALMFGLLVTGGVSILVAPLVSLLGVWAPFVVAAVYAPIGTVLALFLYHVYLGFYPKETLPESLASSSAAPAAGG
jgi:hypothetical protein